MKWKVLFIMTTHFLGIFDICWFDFIYRQRPNEVNISIHEAEFNDKAHRSHKELDDLLAQSGAILESVRIQHMSMYGAKQKIIDLGKAVRLLLHHILYFLLILYHIFKIGLSESTLRRIEKVRIEEWVILIGCAIFFCFFMVIFVIFWWYFWKIKMYLHVSINFLKHIRKYNLQISRCNKMEFSKQVFENLKNQISGNSNTIGYYFTQLIQSFKT